MLIANAGRVLTRETLIDRVWGSDYVGDTKTLDVHIKRLRAKVEADPATPTRIVTIRGLGYKYERRLGQRVGRPARRSTGSRVDRGDLIRARGCLAGYPSSATWRSPMRR